MISGRIVRVRQGWYVEPSCHPRLVAAVRVAGRLTCGSALRLHGVWVADDRGLHVAVTPGACQLRRPLDHSHRLERSDDVTVHWTDRSESGTEFLFRYRISKSGIHPSPQVTIADVGRVDFVIGERLVVEVDGAAYHTDPARFEADRRRDAVLSAKGFRTLRFSYHQVMSRWPTVEAAVLGAIIRGDHH